MKKRIRMIGIPQGIIRRCYLRHLTKILRNCVNNTEKSSNFAHRRPNYKFYNDTQERFIQDAFPLLSGKERCGQPFV